MGNFGRWVVFRLLFILKISFASLGDPSHVSIMLLFFCVTKMFHHLGSKKALSCRYEHIRKAPCRCRFYSSSCSISFPSSGMVFVCIPWKSAHLRYVAVYWALAVQVVVHMLFNEKAMCYAKNVLWEPRMFDI